MRTLLMKMAIYRVSGIRLVMNAVRLMSLFILPQLQKQSGINKTNMMRMQRECKTSIFK
jgi:precorrin-6B methylase 2